NEKRMLQEAVDALIDNGRRGRPVTGPNNRPLKSLSDMLKGKQGRFRQNLLGKRVDYSGRSVIVVGPDLKIYQCGLPKEMAIELFKPFIMKRLVQDGLASNIKSAKKMVERGKPEVWDALETVIKGHPVMLNRAPTLHRLGIEAFEPILVEGRAIKLHPLVCTAFNADFDGDQMAVHLPLSVEAQAEARLLMLSANNLLKPQDGKPVTIPSQDMVLGSYYLTIDRDTERGAGKVFRNADEALMAYDEGVIEIHAPIKVRMTKEIDGEMVSGLVDATAGRLIFNQKIPQDLGFVERKTKQDMLKLEIMQTCGKKELGKIVDRCIRIHGFNKTAEVLDAIKSMGYKYSTKGALTVSFSDIFVPKEKPELIAASEKKVAMIDKKYKRGFITDEERYRLVVREWEKTTNDVTAALTSNMDRFNPITMMAQSGARGSINQIRQLAGMRGLMANAAGKTIEIPIKSNFREGLSVLEYFTSARGARKGLADTALRTADSGYLTRRMVDVSQEVIIREEDCGATSGIWVEDIMDGNSVIEPFAERLTGRYLVEDLYHPETGELLQRKEDMMTEDDAARIVEAGITRVQIRTVLQCRARKGVCAHCYGSNLAFNAPCTMGEAVGIIAAQSIGEPGTQLTMRTFHSGGIAGSDITQGLPRVEELFEARKPKKVATLAEISGVVTIEESKRTTVKTVNIVNGKTGESKSYQLASSSGIRVSDGDEVEQGQQLNEGALNPHDILRILDPRAVQDYLIKEVQKVYRQQGVDLNDKHIEVIVRQMMHKIKVEDAGDTEMLPGAMMSLIEFEDENNKVQARIDAGETELKLATYSPVLMGITKAALATDSFLSAASFQETTRVLTDAAIKGKIDPLTGLKENVLIGKLIPAGSGLKEYRDGHYEEIHSLD
ncbi:MAG TPA: DNA-directed RNA polymerase subunit beta', partial [Candidatus Butyricicoccus stercorigallinarum]|nr:DNA-directed RNA polymerase subunit beta' [Candidatus Butyricicoccus stercorigallinarum]